jgi:predicted acetylornithine/succinylornithine family transaminase
MSQSEDIRALDEKYVLQTYKRLPGVFVRGEGCFVWDEDGNQYLDFLAGIAVCQLGHCHPAVVKAIETQARTLIHTSNFLLTPPQAKLAKKLCEVSGMERVFFTVDGTNANETALKLAKKHGKNRRPSGDYEIISLQNSFHGRSLGSLSATAQAKYQDQFQPLLPGFKTIPINDLSALNDAFNERTAAITFEPIQGEGGVTPVIDEFALEARRLTEKSGALLIIDEVQTGIGRTGQWFAFQHFGFQPDVLCVAKGLGSGMPIGACLTHGFANDIFVPGDHGATFGGNPISTATGLAVLETLEAENLLANATKMGELIQKSIRALGDPVVETRGKGLMIGIKLSKPIARETVAKALEKRLIINATDDFTLRLVPPLIIQPEHVKRAIETIAECLGAAKPALASA